MVQNCWLLEPGDHEKLILLGFFLGGRSFLSQCTPLLDCSYHPLPYHSPKCQFMMNYMVNSVSPSLFLLLYGLGEGKCRYKWEKGLTWRHRTARWLLWGPALHILTGWALSPWDRFSPWGTHGEGLLQVEWYSPKKKMLKSWPSIPVSSLFGNRVLADEQAKIRSLVQALP